MTLGSVDGNILNTQTNTSEVDINIKNVLLNYNQGSISINENDEIHEGDLLQKTINSFSVKSPTLPTTPLSIRNSQREKKINDRFG